MEDKVYKDFFDIDKNYYPVMNEDKIKETPDLWKSFYPHETFIRLIRSVTETLNYKDHRSIRIEGSYGTGKTYAILTLIKMIQAPDSDVREYFSKYKALKTPDGENLLNEFLSAKKGKVLTVYRGHSGTIKSDWELCYTIKDEIIREMKKEGLEDTTKTSAMELASWLMESEDIRRAFDSYIKKNCPTLFGGKSIESVAKEIQGSGGEDAEEAVEKIIEIRKALGMGAFGSSDIKTLVTWIEEVIEKYQLKEIVFFWDEFTDYLQTNLTSLGGFQDLLQRAESGHFTFIVALHAGKNLFGKGSDGIKIFDRFKAPIELEIPDSTAFKLIGEAMKHKEDEVVKREWETIVLSTLINSTAKSRKFIRENVEKGKISEEVLISILPLHPYTALFLKHIATFYGSNQRSMFSFLLETKDKEAKGFRWYIENFGPHSEHKLLTVDMLWEFFYEKGRDKLTGAITQILDCYKNLKVDKLDDMQLSVLKAVYLMDAISKSANGLSLFTPTEDNLKMAFEGQYPAEGVRKAAVQLCRDRQGLLYSSKSNMTGIITYQAPINTPTEKDLEEIKKEVREGLNTSTLILDGGFADTSEGDTTGILSLKTWRQRRFNLRFATYESLGSVCNTLRTLQNEWSISVLVFLAMDNAEVVEGYQKIKELVEEERNYGIVFIASNVTIKENVKEDYIQDEALSRWHIKRNDDDFSSDKKKAKAVLQYWRQDIRTNDFTVKYNFGEGVKERMAGNVDILYKILEDIDGQKYSKAFEVQEWGGRVQDTLWKISSLEMGAECGITMSVKSFYKGCESFIGTDLFKYAKDFPKAEEKYWNKEPYAYISRLKVDIDTMINNKFSECGCISMEEIYDKLIEAPYGFFPCNLVAFVLGFILKEYVGEYRYSEKDNNTGGDLTIAVLKAMIAEVIKYKSGGGKECIKYIVKRTEEERAFDKLSSKVFDIPLAVFNGVDSAILNITMASNKYPFPLWVLQYVSDSDIKGEASKVKAILSSYLKLLQLSDETATTEDKNFSVREIGSLLKNNPTLEDDFKELVSDRNFISGMDNYLEEFDGGHLLILANKIGDNDEYMEILKKRFSKEDSKWLWNKEIAEGVISDIITEYSIIEESNSVIRKTTNFYQTLEEWQESAKYIKITFSLLGNKVSKALIKLLEFLSLLLKDGRSVFNDKDKKRKFLAAIKEGGGEYKDFYTNQQDVFIKVNEYSFEGKGFTESEIGEVMDKLPYSCLVKEKGDYTLMVDNIIGEVAKEKISIKVKEAWSASTSTKSPKEWSNTYKMSILTMLNYMKFNAYETKKIKEAMDTINSLCDGYAVEDRILNNVVSLLKSEKMEEFFSALKEESKRNSAYINYFLEDYYCILKEIGELNAIKVTVCDKLASLAIEAYDWEQNTQVRNKIKEIAQHNYIKTGYIRASGIVNKMNTEERRRYFENLVKENMEVGIEILKRE